MERDKDGNLSYNRTTFISNGKSYKIVMTEAEHAKKVNDVIDHFASACGKRVSLSRDQVFKIFKNGNIT